MTNRALNTRLLPVVALTLLLASPALAAWPNGPAVNVPVCTASGMQIYPSVAPDGVGGSIISWDSSDGPNYGSVFVQRIAAGGRAQWPAGGVLLHASSASPAAGIPIIADGAGGAIVAWADSRLGGYHAYAQRVSSAGTVLWAADGVALSNSSYPTGVPRLVSDGAGGAIVCWTEVRGGYGDIYAQRISAAGTLVWSAGGVAISAASSTQEGSAIVADGAGGAIVAWYDYRNGDTNPDIYAQRVSAAGAVQWTTDGVALCNAGQKQMSPNLVSDGAGGAVVSWFDYRSGTDYDMYAQRVSAAGVPLWTSGGVALCTAAGDQVGLGSVPDGAGGAIVAWRDSRGAPGVYAQRIRASGEVAWTANGASVGTSTARTNTIPTLVPDATGGAIVFWADARNSGSTGDDLYAQQITTGGYTAWTAGGVALCTAAGDQVAPAVTPDGAGGALAAWYDNRNSATTGWDIYAQHVDRWGCLGAQPAITSVTDSPNDQGGWVGITFSASPEDGGGQYLVNEYWFWRQVPQLAATAALARGARLAPASEVGPADPRGVIRTTVSGGQTYYWEYIGALAASGSSVYGGINAPTRCDSVAGSNPRTLYMVEARNTSGANWWFSDPDSGYSVDNLAPAAPSPFTGQYLAGTTRLHWGVSAAADFATFRLHRGHESTFTPGPSNLVVAKADTGYVDAAGAPYFYRLAAVDIHGNLSPFALLQPAGTAAVPGTDAPRELALSAPAPNPARGSCTMRLALPREATVRLAVFDQQGRRMRTLLAGALPAGEHPVAWDGRDDGGRPVASALYFVRLEIGGRAISRRLVVVR